MVGLAAASALTFGAPSMATAAELEILGTPAPATGVGYIVDDGQLLSRAASGSLNKSLKDLEEKTGYHVNVITVKKLVFEQDPFAFGDKVLETWYPTLEEGNNKGNLLLVKNTKEGAIVGREGDGVDATLANIFLSKAPTNKQTRTSVTVHRPTTNVLTTPRLDFAHTGLKHRSMKSRYGPRD